MCMTFGDGVRKCWLYCTSEEYNEWNIVDCETLLGTGGVVEGEGEDFIINNSNKTVNAENLLISGLQLPNLTYNYFQNSNLSAWKVWYCLDNDTARFAWASDILSSETNNPMIIIQNGEDYSVYVRQSQLDNENGCAWVYSGDANNFDGDESLDLEDIVYTQLTNPNIGDIALSNNAEIGNVIVHNISVGRGVIYRLIDEFNNDVAYDFKNIQFVRKLTDGALDTSTGTDTWCYTFNYWEDNTSKEGSVVVSTSEDLINGINNNKVRLRSQQFDAWILPDNVLLGIASDDDFYGYSNCSFHNSWGCTIDGDCTDIQIDSSNRIHVNYSTHLRILCTQNISFSEEDGSIIILGEKVVTEK